jgi:hypothetical protein
MEIPAELIAAFPPSEDVLLACARRAIDDEMLVEIAGADDGTDFDAHLAALRPIRDQGIVPVPLAWRPGEVLELIRWSNPDDPESKPGGTGLRSHQMRAFACAALLRAGAEPENYYYDRPGSSESSLGLCLLSAKALGEEMSEAVARFLTWRILRMRNWSHSESILFLNGLARFREGEPPCEPGPALGSDGARRPRITKPHLVGLLVLAARLRSGRIADPVLGSVADWVLAEESHYRKKFSSSPDKPRACRFQS